MIPGTTRRVPSSAEHVRQHRSLLAASEKRLLEWAARRLPGWVSSDHLTLLGLFSMALAGAAFAAVPYGPWANALVVVALAANWVGDSLDGTLARVRRQQRPRYGFYVDHAIDLAGTTLLLAGLAVSGLMTPMLALAVLCAFLLVSAESYLSTHAGGVFRLSFAGWGPTELRILLAVGVLAAIWRPWVTVGGLGPYRLFDIGGVVAAGALAGIFVANAARQTRQLYLAEPLPEPASQEAA